LKDVELELLKQRKRISLEIHCW